MLWMTPRKTKVSGYAFTAAAFFSLVILSTIASSPAEAATSKWSIFGTREVGSTKLDKFKKWTYTLDRYAKEAPSELEKCQVSPANSCQVAKWRIFLHKIKDKPVREQVELVNAYMNRWAYKLDPVNYGEKDYWATPRQFMFRAGDCEDYAISKYKSLAHLGFPKDKMRVLVLEDLNLKIGHAVLLVEVDGRVLMLDNQITKVIDADRVKHYKPIYSINESGWWLHRS